MARKTTAPSIDQLAENLKVKLEDTSKRGLEHKTAALSYMFVLVFIPLLSAPKDEFIQHHAKQGLILFLIELAINFLAWIVPFYLLAVLILIFTSVIGIIKALNGKYWEIPFVYEWSKKINF